MDTITADVGKLGQDLFNSLDVILCIQMDYQLLH
ncbi:hypothetical protein TNCT_211761, partial [Trichonephila clavata]